MKYIEDQVLSLAYNTLLVNTVHHQQSLNYWRPVLVIFSFIFFRGQITIFKFCFLISVFLQSLRRFSSSELTQFKNEEGRPGALTSSNGNHKILGLSNFGPIIEANGKEGREREGGAGREHSRGKSRGKDSDKGKEKDRSFREREKSKERSGNKSRERAKSRSRDKSKERGTSTERRQELRESREVKEGKEMEKEKEKDVGQVAGMLLEHMVELSSCLPTRSGSLSKSKIREARALFTLKPVFCLCSQKYFPDVFYN
jgi:hypothetical protein